MRILHINHSNRSGGAAIAARRLVLAQRAAGIDAQMLVLQKQGAEPWVHTFGSASIRITIRATRAIAKRYCLALAKTDPGGMRTLGLLPTGLAKKIELLAPDIIHWHWVGAEMVSTFEMAALSIPAVWTCHDEWAFCGAEHYAADDRFVRGYRDAGFLDPDALAYRRKQQAWADWRPHLVCPSNWMREEASRSPLMRSRDSTVIPNTLDFETFRPHDRPAARAELGLPGDKRIILFGAHQGTANPRKGFDLLLTALDQMQASERKACVLATFGEKRKTAALFGMHVHALGEISEEATLAKAYSAADIFVSPSRQDNLPNTLVEAQACGTPCVAFAIGGMGDIVGAPYQGHLVPAFETSEMARAIGYVACRGRNAVRQWIRQDAIERFGPTRVVELHKELYSQLLASAPKAAKS